ncbi:MAG: type I-E CRISPR-associated protein Cas7/Cse4/CasC [Candidatus Nanopelagicales bacterium]
MTGRLYLDIHVLQSVPPSCVNRDDTGTPKSAVYGGVRRARVSSQSWKRATRLWFKDHLPEGGFGVRTKQVVEMVAAEIRQTHAELDATAAEALATAVVGATGLKLAKSGKGRQETQYLVLVSRQQGRTLARIASEALAEAGDIAAAVTALGTAESRREAKGALSGGNSIDLALFGRMVADDTDLNVDASCQVAHAISVHPADPEFDYFTAVDDLKSSAADEAADAGAGMIGTVEFSSATLYRYASICVPELRANLGDSAMTEVALAGFLDAFVRSMPTGKVNTFANHTLPDAVVVTLRNDQPISLVGAFESPVSAGKSGGYAVPASQALAKWADATTECYGIAPIKAWAVGIGAAGEAVSALGERLSFADMPAAVASAAIEQLTEGQ